MAAAGLAAWALCVATPLAGLYWPWAPVPKEAAGPDPGVVLRTLALAAGVAAAAVVLGYWPGQLLGRLRRRTGLALLIVVMPLLLPPHLLWYALSLPLAPSAALGQAAGRNPALAQALSALAAWAAMVLWHWPVAALLIAAGWRSLDHETLDQARLEASAGRRWVSVLLPMLAPSLATAFVACFVLALAEFATPHLARVRTLGAELAVVYELTRSPEATARAAWPLIVAAALAAVFLWRRLRDLSLQPAWPEEPRRLTRPWAATAALWLLSVGLPAALLAANLREPHRLVELAELHRRTFGWSLAIASASAAAALAMAGGALALPQLGRGGRVLAAVVQPTLLLAVFLPGSLLAASVSRLMAALNLGPEVRDQWYPLAAVIAGRFAGLAMVMLHLGQASADRRLDELAAADGAGWLARLWYVHLPTQWPLAAGTLLVLVMLGLAELPATIILLPPGMPSLGQWLLEQMHRLREQAVIATCLALMLTYAAAAGGLVMLMGLLRRRRA